MQHNIHGQTGTRTRVEQSQQQAARYYMTPDRRKGRFLGVRKSITGELYALNIDGFERRYMPELLVEITNGAEIERKNSTVKIKIA